jgi:ABC-type Mn2+/Zn2+ transport system permease subunit
MILVLVVAAAALAMKDFVATTVRSKTAQSCGYDSNDKNDSF